MVLMAARLLAQRKDRLAGQVKFMFQPAEEGPGGAGPMIEEGVLEAPHVNAALAIHVWNDLPLGTIGVRPGPIMASAGELYFTIIGKGGHGAAPHQAVDPVVTAAQLILALQTVVSRQVDPIKSAVITIASIHAGKVFNIIPNEVELLGTLRSFDAELRDTIVEQIERVARGVTEAMGASYRFEHRSLYPATVNDAAMAALVKEAAATVVGPERVIHHDQSMGAEDMSLVLEQVPGCYFLIGSSNVDRGLTNPHHGPLFDFDEDALVVGTEVVVRAVERYLGQG